MTVSLEQAEKKIEDFINKCPHCNHKQYSYTRECEMCRFSWLRYYNQVKGLPLDTPYKTKGQQSQETDQESSQ